MKNKIILKMFGERTITKNMEPDYDDYEPDYTGRAYAEDTLDCIFRDGAI